MIRMLLDEMEVLQQHEMVDLGEERPVDELHPVQEERQTDSPDSETEEIVFCNWQSPLLLLDAAFATSILVMPNAFKHVGSVKNLIGLVGTCLSMMYNALLLYQSTNTLSQRRQEPALSYRATAEYALTIGPDCLKPFASYAWLVALLTSRISYLKDIIKGSGTYAVVMFQMVTYIGTTTLNGVIIANNISYFLGQYTIINVDTFQVEFCLFFVTVCIAAFLHSKYLAVISAVNNMAIPVMFGILLFYFSRDKSSLEGRSPFGDEDTLSEMFSTSLCGLKTLSLFLSIKSKMTGAADTLMMYHIWKTILIIGAAMVYVGVALFGRITAESEPTLKATRSMADMKLDYGGPRRFLNLAMFLFHICVCSFVFDIADNKYTESRLQHRPCVKYLLRTTVVFITFIVPAMIKGLKYVAPVFTLFGLIALGLVFPTLIYTCTFWNSMSRWERSSKMIFNIFIFLIGCSELIFGTWITITVFAERFS